MSRHATFLVAHLAAVAVVGKARSQLSNVLVKTCFLIYCLRFSLLRTGVDPTRRTTCAQHLVINRSGILSIRVSAADGQRPQQLDFVPGFHQHKLCRCLWLCGRQQHLVVVAELAIVEVVQVAAGRLPMALDPVVGCFRSSARRETHQGRACCCTVLPGLAAVRRSGLRRDSSVLGRPSLDVSDPEYICVCVCGPAADSTCFQLYQG